MEERAWSQPWEMRTFPLTDEEVKEIEVWNCFCKFIMIYHILFNFRMKTD